MPDNQWVTTFGCSMTDISVLFKPVRNRTIRQLVPLAFGGSAIRLVLSNEFGQAPLTIDAASIAIADEYGRPRPKTISSLSFAGQASVSIWAGGESASDSLDLAVPNGATLIIDLYLASGALITTGTLAPAVHIALSEPGDHRGDRGVAFISQRPMNIGAAALPPPMLLVRRIDVSTGPDCHAFVAFGDSITQMGTWPKHFTDRLAEAGICCWSLINAGISGNRIIHDAVNGPMMGLFGPAGTRRFATDALDFTGVAAVAIFMGINDLTHPGTLAMPQEVVTAEAMIAGLSSMADQARARGVRVFGCTILPFAGAHDIPADAEVKRQTVNRWIRLTQQFDAVLDFDQAVADPHRPERLNPDFDSGDHLHPNDAGGKAMAQGIDLALFHS